MPRIRSRRPGGSVRHASRRGARRTPAASGASPAASDAGAAPDAEPRDAEPHMSAPVRDAELVTVGPTEAVVTFVTDPGDSVITRVGDREVTTVGPNHVARFDGLEPETDYAVSVDGYPGGDPHLPASFVTLARPKGRLLATLATTNDVHFGETECGQVGGVMEEEIGPVLRAEPGEPPYPETMNRAAIAEIDT